ncbi:hypothetical protein [Streptosporangium sp. NPDC000396]|uniref:hypothetical protein n=1 Tax=Streptosporangium sp. NPDC000396 TaxID=3366185 RepID=UPI0036C1732F
MSGGRAEAARRFAPRFAPALLGSRFAPALLGSRFAPALLGLLFGLLALGPALGPGFALRYDMVFVPDPPLILPGEGFPRAVPSDLVVALLSQVVPAQAVQKALLLGIFVLAASGAAALVSSGGLDSASSGSLGPRQAVATSSGRLGSRQAAAASSGSLGPRLAAAAFYAWNAYLAQRLLLGQWALLLGVAGLPWAVRAVALGGRLRLMTALLPAAVGGFQAMLVSALVVLPTAATAPIPLGRAPGAPDAGAAPGRAGSGQGPEGTAPGRAGSGRGPGDTAPDRSTPGRARRTAEAVSASDWGGRARRTAEAALILGGLSLPWLVPALLSRAVTDPAGVEAFAARADGPLGTVGSLLSLGGIWNANAVVPGQGSWWSAGVRLALAAVAVWGFAWLWGRESGAGSRPSRPGGFARLRGRGAPPYLTGVAVAAGTGLAIALTGAFAPGLLKNLISWWPGFGPFRDGQLYLAPLVLLQAVGLAAVVARWDSRVVASVAVAVPVLVLPTFALGAFGRLAAVDYPDEWRRVQAIVNADPSPGALLSLPWGAHRAFAWNGHRVVLDPAIKMFRRRVLWNDALLVGLPGGGRLRVAAEDPAVTAAEAALRAVPGERAAALAGLGVRYVLSQVGDNTFHDGVIVFEGRELRLLRLDQPS